MIKSMVTTSHGCERVSNGFNSPEVSPPLFFAMRQTGHDNTYWDRSFQIPGHQNCLYEAKMSCHFIIIAELQYPPLSCSGIYSLWPL